jgi:hypothetical protein
MAEYENTMSYLTKEVVDWRVKGFTLEETANKIGIPVEDAVVEWQSYVASHKVETKEERWLLHLLRLENLLTKVNLALETSDNIEDYEVVLKLLDRVEALQSLNLSRKEEAEREADKANRLMAEQVIGIVTATHKAMVETLEKAFNKHKVGKVARETILTDMGEKYLPKALEAIEAEIED